MSSFPPPPPPPGGFRRPPGAPGAAKPPQGPPSNVRQVGNQRFAPPPSRTNGGMPAPQAQAPPPAMTRVRSTLPTPPPPHNSRTVHGSRPLAPPPPSIAGAAPRQAHPPGAPPNVRTPGPPSSHSRPPSYSNPSPPGPPAVAKPFAPLKAGGYAPPPSMAQQGPPLRSIPPPPPPQFGAPPPPLDQLLPSINGHFPPEAFKNTSSYAGGNSSQPLRPPPPQSTGAYANPNDARPRIDPSQIPKPPIFTRPGVVPNIYYPNHKLGVPPPPADSRFTSVDDGNASPRFIRSTLYSIPKDRGLWHDTGDLPLGIMCTPLAAPSVDYTARPRRDGSLYRDPEAVPLVTSLPNRCSTCWVYTNPQWQQQQDRCWGCGTRVATVPSGLPAQLGTVEYAVQNKDYCTRDTPVQPVHLYAVDLTLLRRVDAIVTIIQHVGAALTDHWERQRAYHMTSPTPIPAPRIGLCFVTGLGLLVRNRADDRYIVCADVTQEPFCGLPLDQWTYDVLADAEAWTQLAEEHLPAELPYWIQATTKARIGELDGLEVACGGAALALLADALETSGGRGTLLTQHAPRYGTGGIPSGRSSELPLQELKEFANPAEEKAAKFYKELGSRCAKARVSLSVALLGENAGGRSLEIATLSELCRGSCGNLMWIPHTPDWTDTLREELLREALSFTGWDAVFKVRCSKGLAVKSFLCPTGVTIETLTERELELASVSQRTSIAVELEHRVGGLSGQNAFVQTALLYTNIAGQRRLRVSTLGVIVGSTVPDVFRYADFGAQSCFLLRDAIQCFRTPDSDSKKKARDLVLHKGTIHPLSSYRRASTSVPGQLLLPEQLQLLPLFSMGLLKSPVLSPNMRGMPNPITPDDRAYFAWLMSQAGPTHTMLMTYPNIFEIIGDPPVDWSPPEEEGGITGCATMPPSIVPSMESLREDKVYLIDDGARIYLYVGTEVDPSTAAALDANAEPNEWKSNLYRMVDQMRVYSSTTAEDLRPTSAPLVRLHDKSVIYRLMVADASAAEKDYVEFLCSVHRRVRENSK